MVLNIKPLFIFKVQSFLLRGTGLWPGPENHYKNLNFFAFNVVLHLIFLVFEINFAVNSIDNGTAMMESLIIFLTRILVLLKMMVLFLRYNELQELLEVFDNLVTEDKKSSSLSINNSMRKIELFYTRGFLCLAVATITSYISLPFIKYLITGNNTWELPFLVRYPFDYRYFPMYQIVYVVMSYALCIAIMILVGVDGTLYGSCLYIAGQFQIIERKIIDLVDWAEDDPSKPMTVEENKKMNNRLADIVRHHNLCSELADKTSNIFKVSVLSNFCASSIVMAMCSVNIILADNMDKLRFTSYLTSALIQLFCYCKNGSTMTDASARLPVAIYNFDWFRCDRRVKYAILTILMRSQRPVELQIPFLQISMETFAAYVQSIGSLITLLQSFL